MGMPVAPTFVFPTNGFRFRDDTPDPSSADAAFAAGDAAAGTDLTLDLDTLMRVRILLQQTNASATATHADMDQEFNIQYRIDTGGGFGSWTNIGAIGTTAEAVIFAAGTPADQAALATQRLGAGTFADGIYMESDPSTTNAVNFTDTATSEAEIEFAFEVISEVANADDVIELRVQFVTAPTNTPTWNDDPSITVASAGTTLTPSPVTMPLVIPTPFSSNGEVTVKTGLDADFQWMAGHKRAMISRGDYEALIVVDTAGDLDTIWTDDNWLTNTDTERYAGSVQSFAVAPYWEAGLDSYKVLIAYSDSVSDTIRFMIYDLQNDTLSTSDTSIGGVTSGEAISTDPNTMAIGAVVAKSGRFFVAAKETDNTQTANNFELVGWYDNDDEGATAWNAWTQLPGLSFFPTTTSNSVGSWADLTQDNLAEDDDDILAILADTGGRDIWVARWDHSVTAWDTPVRIVNDTQAYWRSTTWYAAHGVLSNFDAAIGETNEVDVTTADPTAQEVNANADPLTATGYGSAWTNEAESGHPAVSVRQEDDSVRLMILNGGTYTNPTRINMKIYTGSWGSELPIGVTTDNWQAIGGPATLDDTLGGWFTPWGFNDDTDEIVVFRSQAVDYRIAGTNLTPSAVTLPGVVPAPAISMVLTLTPDPVTAPGVVPAPTVSQLLTLTPDPVALPGVVPDPALTFAPLSLAVDPVTLPGVVPDPALTFAPLSLTVNPVAMPGVVPDPAITQLLTLTPDPVAMPSVVPDPSMDLLLTLAPDPVAAPLVIPTPDVSQDIDLVPDPVTLPSVVPAPTLTFGALSLAVDPVTAPLVVPDPTIVVPKVFAPDPVTLPGVVPDPAVSMLLTLTPSPVTAPGVVPDPAITFGPLSLTVDPVALPGVIPDPVVSLSSLELTPDPVTLPGVVPAPVVSQLLTLTPSAVTMPGVVPDPALTLLLTLLPDPVAAPLVVPDPTVALPTNLTPDPVTLPGVVPAPAITQLLTLAPSAVTMPGIVPDPALTQLLTLSPNAVELPAVVPDPAISLGALVLTPDPRTLPAVVPAPGISQVLNLAPTPVAAPLVVPDPAVTIVAFLAPDPVSLTLVVPTPTRTETSTPLYVSGLCHYRAEQYNFDVENIPDVVVTSQPNQVMYVVTHLQGDEEMATVTYAGQSLTREVHIPGLSFSEEAIELWYLADPPVGTADVVFTTATGQILSQVTCAYLVSSIDQSNPVEQTVGFSEDVFKTTIEDNMVTVNNNAPVMAFPAWDEGISTVVDNGSTVVGDNKTLITTGGGWAGKAVRHDWWGAIGAIGSYDFKYSRAPNSEDAAILVAELRASSNINLIPPPLTLQSAVPAPVLTVPEVLAPDPVGMSLSMPTMVLRIWDVRQRPAILDTTERSPFWDLTERPPEYEV